MLLLRSRGRTCTDCKRRRRLELAKLMSEQLKNDLGRRMGVAHIVEREGWGGVPARECGALVRAALEVAEQDLARIAQRRP